MALLENAVAVEKITTPIMHSAVNQGDMFHSDTTLSEILKQNYLKKFVVM